MFLSDIPCDPFCLKQRIVVDCQQDSWAYFWTFLYFWVTLINTKIDYFFNAHNIPGLA